MPNVRGMFVPVLLGAGDAFVRDQDVKAGRATLMSQWGTWAEAGAVIVGYMAGQGGYASMETAEDLMEVGSAFLAERVTRSFLTGSFGTGAPSRLAGRSMAGIPYRAAAPFPVKEPSPTIF